VKAINNNVLTHAKTYLQLFTWGINMLGEDLFERLPPYPHHEKFAGQARAGGLQRLVPANPKHEDLLNVRKLCTLPKSPDD
jgi:hypothetical protein